MGWPTGAARLAALGEVGAVGEWGPKFKQVANPALEQEIKKLRELVAANMREKFDERTLHRNIVIETQKQLVADMAKHFGDTSGWADIGQQKKKLLGLRPRSLPKKP